MGCGSSKGSVVPLEAGGGGACGAASNGTAHALRTGGGAGGGGAGGGGARVPGSGQSRGLSRRPSEAPAIEGSDPPEEDLPKELPELREIVRAGGKNMAFEVPLSDERPRPLALGPAGGGAVDIDSSGARRPPRRLQRLEDAPLPPSQRLTHRLLDERQEAADERRMQILTQRVQSAQQRVPTRRARDGSEGDGLGSSGSYVDSLAGSRGSRNEELLETLKYAKHQRGP